MSDEEAIKRFQKALREAERIAMSYGASPVTPLIHPQVYQAAIAAIKTAGKTL